MGLRSAAKWLGIYLVCNLITAAGLFAAFSLLVHFAPPITPEKAVEIARGRLNMDYTTTPNFLTEHHADCAVENYPEGQFGRNQAFEVTCSLVHDSILVARTTFVFGRDGLAGHETWDLDGQNE